MIMTSTQFLQVPKIVPNKKGRSRSKSRSQDVVSVEELRSLSTKRFSNPTPQQRPQSPTSPTKTSMTTFATPRTLSPVNGLHSPTLYNAKNTIRRTPPPPEPEMLQDMKVAAIVHTVPIRKISTPTALLPRSPAPCEPRDLNGAAYTVEESFSPPPVELPLRDKIIGAWKLESYVAYPTEASTIKRPTYPMTRNVTGFIMYTPDGYMSAQMLIPGQHSFKRGEGEEPQWAEAAKRCFSYCGPYYITNEGPGREEVLRHTFQVCNLPGWIGDVQVRTHKFEEDGQVLVLGSEEPTEIKGDKRRPVLKWRRARNNVDGVPPPPTPAIKISGPGEP